MMMKEIFVLKNNKATLQIYAGQLAKLTRLAWLKSLVFKSVPKQNYNACYNLWNC